MPAQLYGALAQPKDCVVVGKAAVTRPREGGAQPLALAAHRDDLAVAHLPSIHGEGQAQGWERPGCIGGMKLTLAAHRDGTAAAHLTQQL